MNKVNLLINEYQKQGYNKAQSASLAWADHFEDRMADIEYKYQGNVDSTIRIDTYCKDCKEGGQFLPYTVKSFISRHKDHNTTTFKIK